MENVRSYNVGASDYSRHKYQSWDFWLTFVLNPFDADLCKRILRTKATDTRLLDYQKIKHICGERLRQLEEGLDKWVSPKYVEKSHFEEMILDYSLLEDDKQLLENLLYLQNRKEAYKNMQNICDKRIAYLSSTNKEDNMKKWNVKCYAVKRLNLENEVEYWDFFLEKWVTPENVNNDCITTQSAASCIQEEFSSSEIVGMNVIIEEK